MGLRELLRRQVRRVGIQPGVHRFVTKLTHPTPGNAAKMNKDGVDAGRYALKAVVATAHQSQ